MKSEFCIYAKLNLNSSSEFYICVVLFFCTASILKKIHAILLYLLLKREKGGEKKKTCTWSLHITFFFFNQISMNLYTFLYFYRKQRQNKVWVGVDLKEKTLHRWPWQTGIQEVRSTWNEQELLFKSEIRLFLYLNQGVLHEVNIWFSEKWEVLREVNIWCNE